MARKSNPDSKEDAGGPNMEAEPTQLDQSSRITLVSTHTKREEKNSGLRPVCRQQEGRLHRINDK